MVWAQEAELLSLEEVDRGLIVSYRLSLDANKRHQDECISSPRIPEKTISPSLNTAIVDVSLERETSR